MIDYVILSNTRTEKDYAMTSGLLSSLGNTVYPAENGFESYRVTIVENNPGCGGFRYPASCDVVFFDMGKYGMFNYNYALNIGYSHCLSAYGDGDWMCVFNNDVTCEPDWITEISKAVTINPAIESIGPNPHARGDGVDYGYTLFQHMDGCCIMHRRSVLGKIGMWDEEFDFAYQDDDYLERCRSAGVVHARVKSSVIHHLGSATIDYTTELAMRGLRKFVCKYSREVLVRREAEKNAYRRSVNL